MANHGSNFGEKLLVVMWTAVLMFLPTCPYLGDVFREGMTSGEMLVAMTSSVVLLLGVSLIMPLSRVGEQVANWAPVHSVRMLLNLLLPMLSAAIMTHPVTLAWRCVTKKFVILEGQLMKRWCPEAYIIILSLSFILAIFRRASVRVPRSKADSHVDPDHEQNMKMIKYTADQLCEQRMNRVVPQ